MELIIKAVKTFFYFFLGNQNVQAAPGEKSCCCLGCKGCVKALCHFLQQYSAECTWKCFHFSVLLLSNSKYSPLFHESDSINNDLSINTFARNRHVILDISIHWATTRWCGGNVVLESPKVRRDGLWAPWWSCRCSCSGSGIRWPLRVPSSSSHSMRDLVLRICLEHVQLEITLCSTERGRQQQK